MARFRAARASLLFGLLLASVCRAELRFSVSYSSEQFVGPFTGKVVVYLSKRSNSPKNGPNWFQPEPMYAAEFKNSPAGAPMLVSDANAVGFPGKIADLPAGEYTVQAVIDRNLGGRAIGSSPGNLYSTSKRATLDPKSDQTISLACDEVVLERPFRETRTVKEAKVRSELLSVFYKRDTYLRAAVSLPQAYFDEPNRRFPAIYEIPGFGGNHRMMSGREARGTMRDGVPFLHVTLDPDCPTGHSVFADSANNGPWGKALTTELIPHIESTFRGIGKPGARFVTGHSSGGWSSLWLQVAYPDFFGGVWSTAPDPVDFRDFQRIDLYKPGVNMFTDENGEPRPIARFGERPALFYRQFSDMERPIRGEQLGSFEAVFSPMGPDGQPMRLWDRDTGAVDPKVAEAWKKYDIGLILRMRWPELGPKLKGKLHVYMGDSDTFYLEGAVKLLQRDLKALGSDAAVEIVPGDHGSMMTRELRERIDREMAARFRSERPTANSR